MDCSHIKFCADKSKVDFEQLQQLFSKTAFWAQERNIGDLKTAIANSNPVVTVWDQNRLIGFARATSDGVYRAGIWDVIIDPDYQGAGLGRKLVQTVLSHPLVSKTERVYLTTTHQQSFYKRIGFKKNETTTMVLYNNPESTEDLARRIHEQWTIDTLDNNLNGGNPMRVIRHGEETSPSLTLRNGFAPQGYNISQ